MRNAPARRKPALAFLHSCRARELLSCRALALWSQKKKWHGRFEALGVNLLYVFTPMLRPLVEHYPATIKQMLAQQPVRPSQPVHRLGRLMWVTKLRSCMLAFFSMLNTTISHPHKQLSYTPRDKPHSILEWQSAKIIIHQRINPSRSGHPPT